MKLSFRKSLKYTDNHNITFEYQCSFILISSISRLDKHLEGSPRGKWGEKIIPPGHCNIRIRPLFFINKYLIIITLIHSISGWSNIYIPLDRWTTSSITKIDTLKANLCIISKSKGFWINLSFRKSLKYTDNHNIIFEY